MEKIESSGYPASDGKKWVDLLTREMFVWLKTIKKHKPSEKCVEKLQISINELRVAYIKELVYRWDAQRELEKLGMKLGKFDKRRYDKNVFEKANRIYEEASKYDKHYGRCLLKALEEAGIAKKNFADSEEFLNWNNAYKKYRSKKRSRVHLKSEFDFTSKALSGSPTK